MGWHIQNFENNTLKITPEIAQALFDAQDYPEEIWYDVGGVAYSGFLAFNSDHMEHMDYLSNNDKIVAVLRKFKVKGRVLFCSHEGDNAGEYWGHYFDGQGGYTALVGVPGTITWEPAEESANNDRQDTRLEFVDGKSSKFWEVRTVGCDVIRTWGKIGTEGQTKTETFENPHEARSQAAKLYREKRDKGYEPV